MTILKAIFIINNGFCSLEDEKILQIVIYMALMTLPPALFLIFITFVLLCSMYLKLTIYPIQDLKYQREPLLAVALHVTNLLAHADVSPAVAALVDAHPVPTETSTVLCRAVVGPQCAVEAKVGVTTQALVGAGLVDTGRAILTAPVRTCHLCTLVHVHLTERALEMAKKVTNLDLRNYFCKNGVLQRLLC